MISIVPPSTISGENGDGSFFRFWPYDLTRALGGMYWSDASSSEEHGVHVKGGGGVWGGVGI